MQSLLILRGFPPQLVGRPVHDLKSQSKTTFSRHQDKYSRNVPCCTQTPRSYLFILRWTKGVHGLGDNTHLANGTNPNQVCRAYAWIRNQIAISEEMVLTKIWGHLQAVTLKPVRGIFCVFAPLNLLKPLSFRVRGTFRIFRIFLVSASNR